MGRGGKRIKGIAEGENNGHRVVRGCTIGGEHRFKERGSIERIVGKGKSGEVLDVTARDECQVLNS